MKPTKLVSKLAMPHRRGLLGVALLCSSPLLAQSGLEVKMAVDGAYARVTDVITVTLDIAATSEAEIPSEWLMGRGLTFTVDGKPLGKTRASKKTVKVAKGAKLAFELPVALAEVFERTRQRPEIGETVDLGISIPGFSHASATVKVAADPSSSSLSVGDLDPRKTRVALVTNFGTMVLEFRSDKAPKHVENFLKLSLAKFYDGTRFHRIMKGFMIQGGDPNTKNDDPSDDGRGGPGWTIDAEFNDVPHTKGILSMARSTSPNSAGSQFFIMHDTTPALDGKYTVFGRVVTGIEIIDRICEVPVGFRGQEQSVPTQPVKLIRAVVLGVRKG